MKLEITISFDSKNSFFSPLTTMKKIEFLLFLFATAISYSLHAQPGTLDNTFGTDGTLVTTISMIGDQAFSVAVQPDGKIVVAGVSTTTTADFTLARYNTDGSLDNTFGTAGIVTTAIGEGNDYAKSVILQPDGKIIAAGYSSNGIDNDFAVVRYNSDGTPDNSFSTDGKMTLAIGPADDYGLSAVLQPDGKIVVAGYSNNGNDNDIAVIRLNADGTPDAGFGTNGIITTTIGTGNDYCYSAALQPDGKIAVAGASQSGFYNDFALVRYNVDGSLDNSFGTNGRVTTPVSVKNDFAYSIVIQPDTEIVVAGFAYNGVDNDFALARYKTNGTLDSSFSYDGIQTTGIGTDYDYAYAITLQPDGKIIAAGDLNIVPTFDFAVARYNTNGELDSTFGADGKVTTAIGTGYDYGYAAALQPDGKIVVVGSSESGAGSHFAAARYLTDFGTGLVDIPSFITQTFIYPNPVVQCATLGYELKFREDVSIRLSDINGKIVQTFISNESRDAGKNLEEIELPANLPHGEYFIVIVTSPGNQASIRITR